MSLQFGLEEEWTDFERRHPRFVARLPELEGLLDQVFSRKFETSRVPDRVIFYLGRVAVEDFAEILLNVGNGYGVAGLKLLRPMFERVITAMHLIRHQDEVGNFLDYHQVHMRKTVNHIKAAGGDPGKYLTAEQLAEIESGYQAVKPRFLEVLCSQCGTTRDAFSWTKTDLATMARNVGLGRAYLTLCYVPTLHLHTTVQAIVTRLEETEGGAAFKPGAQRKEADAALLGAHTCLSILLDDQIKHFGLAADVNRVQAIYQECWPDKAEASGDKQR